MPYHTGNSAAAAQELMHHFSKDDRPVIPERQSKLGAVPSDAMIVFAEALARGVQRHGAALALYAAADHLHAVGVCGVVQDVPPIAKKRCWAREWVQGCRLWMAHSCTQIAHNVGSEEPVWWDEDKASHDADGQCTSRKLEDCKRISNTNKKHSGMASGQRLISATANAAECLQVQRRQQCQAVLYSLYSLYLTSIALVGPIRACNECPLAFGRTRAVLHPATLAWRQKDRG